ncbi:MAG TPA: patatin-like phospholipase family protein [Candidatus Nitrosocosmicus sp.]
MNFKNNNKNENTKRHTQRALVLQGGGTLGAYEAGVLKVLCKKLGNNDRKCDIGKEGDLLFHVVAGSSIGAMNGAIFVSQFLNTLSWEKASEKLVEFWRNQLSVKNIDISDVSGNWYNQWIKRNPTAATEEAARRYYSVKKLLLNQVRNNMYYQCAEIEDNKFFDKSNILSKWFLHSNKPLQDSIEKYATFPIATEFFDKNNIPKQYQQYPQPRLLVFSVDVAEGEIVTFDSYPKSDGSRRTEYGNKLENVIEYNDGISIDQVMASGTVPEIYDYAPIKIQSTSFEQRNQDDRCKTDIKDKKNTRYFWDGGWLSNTPFRELLQAHQEYWDGVGKIDKIPDLEVYIINIHPRKIDIDILPVDYDGVKDRQHDIIYSDRNSHYDENTFHLLTDYNNFVNQMNDLVNVAISKVNDEKDKKELQEKLKSIFQTETMYKDGKEESRKYERLLESGFKLSKVVRIERSNYINNISGKTGDLTFETIDKLIKEGECDAWLSLIQDDIKNMKIDNLINNDTCNKLLNRLNKTTDCLRNSDYEDTNSQTYHNLTCLSDEIKECNIESHNASMILQSIEELKEIL